MPINKVEGENLKVVCTFCRHLGSSHIGNKDFSTGCTEDGCVCAVFDTPADRADYARYKKAVVTPVTITANELANKIHRLQHPNEDHSGGHSCPCTHVALYYLGLTDSTGVFWPDGKGGNAWKARKH